MYFASCKKVPTCKFSSWDQGEKSYISQMFEYVFMTTTTNNNNNNTVYPSHTVLEYHFN